MKSTADILREARALIDTPEKWIKGQEALDADGNSVFPGDERATCFCALGALSRVMCSPFGHPLDVLRGAINGDEWQPIHKFNDAPETTHADVLAAFDRAIALAETQAGVGPMTWLLVVPAFFVLAAIVVIGYMEWFASRPSTPLDERLDRADIAEDERERLAREYRRGPRGWTF